MELYRIVPLRENLWAISEGERSVMYVINGEERTLLLDTGFGMVPLAGVVKELCGEKPLVVVNSHGHPDHNGGNNQFSTVYVGRFDEPDSHQLVTEEEKEATLKGAFHEFLEKGGSVPVGWNPGPAPHIVTLQEGDVLNLGGIVLKVLECPGHSLGSIALFEEKQGWLFTGDLMLTWEVWGHLPRSTVLKVYGETLNRLAEMQNRVSVIFPAHWQEDRNPLGLPPFQLPPETLSIYAEGTQQILRGELPAEDFPFPGVKAKSCSFKIGGMVFDPSRLA